MLHNHPSGDPEPSPADIKVTREVIRAGELLKIEVLDHVIIGEGKYASLRELGYFEQPRIEQTRSRKVRMKQDRRTGVTTVQT